MPTINYVIEVEATGNDEDELREYAERILAGYIIDACRYGSSDKMTVKSTGFKEVE